MEKSVFITGATVNTGLGIADLIICLLPRPLLLGK